MRAHRRLARALVAVSLALAPAAVAGPAAASHDGPPHLGIEISAACQWMVRGEPALLQVRVAGDSAVDLDPVSLVPVLPPGFTAEVTPPAARVFAGSARIFDVAITAPADAVIGNATTLRLDAVGPGVTTTYEYRPAIADVPAAATGVTAAPGDGAALVTWSPGPYTGFGVPEGYPPRARRYTVTASPGGARTAVVDDTSARVAGLANGTAYTFTVREWSVLGDGVPSAPSAPVTPVAAPAAPVPEGAPPKFGGEVLVRPLDGMVDVTLTDAPSDVTGWLVTSQPDGMEQLVTAYPRADGTVGGDTWVANVVNGTSVTVTVRAVNAAGAGPPSDPTPAVRPVTGPGQPYLDVSVTREGTADFCFQHAWGGGSTVTSYVVVGDDYDAGTRRTWEVAPGARTGRLTGLEYGRWYQLAVFARTEAFPEPDLHFAAYDDSVVPEAPPPAPQDVHVEAGDGYAYLTWSGVGVDRYEVVTQPGGATQYTQGDSAWVSNLTNGTAYTFTVRAIDEHGGGAASAPTSPVTPSGVPGPVTRVTAVPDPDDPAAALVSWAPADPNGSPVTAYRVAWDGHVTHAAGDATSVSVPAGYGSHLLFVDAANANGTGEEGEPVSVHLQPPGEEEPPPPALPGKVTGVTAVPDTAGTAAVLLSWSPAEPNGLAVTAYHVSSDATSVTVHAAGDATSVLFPVGRGEPHTFTVGAVNAAGAGPPSDPAGPVTVPVPPPVVTPPPAVTLSGSASVGYTAAGAASYDVRYRVARFDGGFGPYHRPAAWQGTAAASAALPATQGRTYCFGVRARDAAGHLSDWSGDACTTAPLDDRALAASAGWTRGTNGAYLGGTYSLSKAAGATLTRASVQARRLALVATRCPTCGTVGVYVDGVLVRKVGLASSVTAYRKVIVVDLGSARSGTVTLRALNAGRVYVDGLAALP